MNMPSPGASFDHVDDGLVAARSAIAPLYLAGEAEVVATLLPMAVRPPELRATIDTEIERLIVALRSGGKTNLVERFMQQYELTSAEGTALLSLAEAYLRIPDSETATALIRDKTGSGDWRAHAGGSSSLMVNAATFGLTLAKALNAPGGGTLRRLVARLGEPVIRVAVATVMRSMGEQFVLGRTIGEALERSGKQGIVCSFDMLGEGARSADDAERYFAAYADAIAAVGRVAPELPMSRRHSISVKLSALHPRYEEAQMARTGPVLVERLRALALLAKAAGIALTVDAEESDRLEASLDIIEQVAADPALAGWDGLGMAVQAYQKRALAVIDWADALGRSTGRRIAVRLVKGAYWDTEIKAAQEQGLPAYPVFTRREATDVSYIACARRMLASAHIAPAFATHNAVTFGTLCGLIGDRDDIEFQQLHGMGHAAFGVAAADRGLVMRVYAPVGGYRDLLAYLVRRLLENGANSGFIHQAGAEGTAIADLAVDPVDMVAVSGGRPHDRIPAPVDLYGGERANSHGMALGDRATLAGLVPALARHWTGRWNAAPIVSGAEIAGTARAVFDPADTARTVGTVIDATVADVAAAVTAAAHAATAWSARPVAERADCLRRMADLMERDRDVLMALAVREAGKSIPDALAEVREAVDFCRYYAGQAERLCVVTVLPGPTGELNELSVAGRGVFACISPWNFPLAIFVGQVAAALVAGNSVVAKPAPQTPLISAAAVRLLIEAGVPADVIHLVPGGPEIGAALTANPAVAGVAFTGSGIAARKIARSLLDDEDRPLVPLIAETGGLNAMIVDSTALLEQVVDDVIASAFASAGQRCSALRLLVVQEDICEPLIELLIGAMRQLVIGDPGDPATDVGPIIDEAACQRIEAYVEAEAGRVLYRVPGAPASGHFTAPTLIRLDRIEDLKREIFGPVLHVTTWRGGELDETVDRINASGYGLTMGLHSRLAHHVDRVRARARVGNLYVNRSTIGAVVGVQPFGGEGLSGTGPKAGGPLYLTRFVVERSVSIDTTSSGGNATLLSLSPDA